MERKQSLLESYSRQLRIAEAYVAKNFEGKKISANTELTTAVLLDNTNRWLTESMNTAATERADLGDWKKFCLNLTNLAVPTLIANDLVIVHPMTSYSGSVAYLSYVSKTDKGDVKKGDVFNSVFGLGKMSDARRNFTSQVIIDTITEDGGELTLTPMATGAFKDGKDVKVIKADGTVEYYAVTTGKVDGYTASKGDKIAYLSEEFQMEHVPAQDIPTIGPKMEHKALVAEPRRIAVKYDQISVFQAKTDYGFSLDKQIAEQACGELAYEIDCDIIDMLYTAAKENTSEEEAAKLTWSKTLPVGVSKFEHYNGFLEIVDIAQGIIYNRTKKFEANYMVCARDVLNVLTFVSGWKAVSAKKNGPYKAGTLGTLDVYVDPDLDSGEYFFGLNGSDMMSSAGVYAPYMAIVPTQTLGTPDGGLAQGFSTWYAKAILNENLLVAGKIVA